MRHTFSVRANMRLFAIRSHRAMASRWRVVETAIDPNGYTTYDQMGTTTLDPRSTVGCILAVFPV